MTNLIEGITEQDLETTEVSSVGVGKRFPAKLGEWTNHVAEVEAMEISRDGKHLIINARNGEFQQWLYIGIQVPRDGVTDAYKKRMAILLKTFGIYKSVPGGVDIDTDKLESAKGKLFRFGAYGAKDEDGGWLLTKNGYPIVNFTVNGPADNLLPIVGEPVPSGKANGNGNGNGNGGGGYNGGYDSDIPF